MVYIFDKNGLNQLQTNHFKHLKPKILIKLVPTETFKSCGNAFGRPSGQIFNPVGGGV